MSIVEKSNSAYNTESTVQIVLYDEENDCFNLDIEALQNLLLSPQCSNLRVQIISVAGAFRRGKSFLLNFFVKYLLYLQKYGSSKIVQPDLMKNSEWINTNRLSEVNRKSSDIHDSSTCLSDDDDDSDIILPDWLKDDVEKYIQGFKWRGGSQRETTGLVMWKHPFIIDLPEGKVAILLMDTQGTFDWSSTVKNCATVFALSCMLSSVQIYNLSHNIQEDDLNHLQYFTEYGRLALEHSESKPFQKLLFLVRDWCYSYEFKFGFCDEYMETILKPTPKQPVELQAVRKHIYQCFESISCFLMPFPGESVASKVRFKGNVKAIDKKFLRFVGEFVETTMNPQNINPRRFEGTEITCKDLFFYFQTYMKVFKSNFLPEPKNLLLATAEAGHLSALKSAQESYVEEMTKVAGGDQPYLASDILKFYHLKASEAAISLYQGTPKMGVVEMNEEYLTKLRESIDKRYSEFEKNNDSKNIVKSVRFIIIAFIILIINLIFSEIFEFIGIEILQYPFVLLGKFCLAIMVFWVYVKVSGHLTESLAYLNSFADIIWETGREHIQKAILNSTSSNIASFSTSRSDSQHAKKD